MLTYYERNREVYLARANQYYAEHKKQCLAQNHKYYMINRSKRNAHDREYYHQHKEALLKRMKEYYYTNKPKRSAEIRAWFHVPIGVKCEKCGATERLERHHNDYDKPLEIQTLCRTCHARLHLGLKEP